MDGEYNWKVFGVSTRMSSYAEVAATNAPPLDQQPKPDQALVNTTPPSASPIPTDSKIQIMPPRASEIFGDEEEDFPIPSTARPPAPDRRPKKTSRRVRDVQEESAYIWSNFKDILLRPGVAGGLVGLGTLPNTIPDHYSQNIVNVGIVACVGRAFYLRPELRADKRVITSVVAASLAVVSLEGFATSKYAETPRGREEIRRAKEEGSLVYRYLHEHILRPKVLGGMLGLGTAFVLVYSFHSNVLCSEHSSSWGFGIRFLSEPGQGLGQEASLCHCR